VRGGHASSRHPSILDKISYFTNPPLWISSKHA
jgi:hypothetical protein